VTRGEVFNIEEEETKIAVGIGGRMKKYIILLHRFRFSILRICDILILGVRKDIQIYIKLIIIMTSAHATASPSISSPYASS
jgi:hypothetical protein